MGLRRKLLIAKIEEGDDLRRKGLGCSETLGEEHDLGNELSIRPCHGHPIAECEDDAVN